MLVPIPGLSRRVRSQASEHAAVCARSAHHGGMASPPSPTAAGRLERPDSLIQVGCKRLPKLFAKLALLGPAEMASQHLLTEPKESAIKFFRAYHRMRNAIGERFQFCFRNLFNHSRCNELESVGHLSPVVNSPAGVRVGLDVAIVRLPHPHELNEVCLIPLMGCIRLLVEERRLRAAQRLDPEQVNPDTVFLRPVDAYSEFFVPRQKYAI